MKLSLVTGMACFIADMTIASVLLPRAVVSNSTSPAPSQMAASLPPCAMGCIAAEVPKSACNATDFACICTNEPLNGAIAACLTQNCTVIESLRKYEPCGITCTSPYSTDGELYSKRPRTIQKPHAACRSAATQSKPQSPGLCLDSRLWRFLYAWYRNPRP
ncbi:hypothetical protein LZ30DRAFT_602163 [Colletotrichum cereale]|nr:hypothetical protein LZ30DRAFT_602163 [Colletotrichum cereale]